MRGKRGKRDRARSRGELKIQKKGKGERVYTRCQGPYIYVPISVSPQERVTPERSRFLSSAVLAALCVSLSLSLSPPSGCARCTRSFFYDARTKKGRERERRERDTRKRAGGTPERPFSRRAVRRIARMRDACVCV